MNEFFADLGERWVEAAGRVDVEIKPPALDAQVALELLELARTAAHTRERRFAPLSCYLAGIAVERVRQARTGFDDADAAALIREIWKALDGGE